MQSLLKSSNLKSILRTEAILISEIKNLDGERKALVYDNYSKLIKATQTIGNMQEGLNARNVGDLEKLQPTVAGIERMAEELNNMKGSGGAAGVNRKETQRRELARWVVGAPARFDVYVEEGRQDEMKNEWKDVSMALSRWKGVNGVDQIKSKCEEIMANATDDAG